MNARKGKDQLDDAGLIYKGFSGSKCLTFWYQMKGKGVAALELWVDYATGESKMLKRLRGSQIAWKKEGLKLTGKIKMVSIKDLAHTIHI